MSWRALVVLSVTSVLTAWWFLGDASIGLPLDDAWVHLVYARAFALGEVFAYNTGRLEAGVTAPLWTALLALSEWAGPLFGSLWRPDLGARLLGGLAGLGMAVAAFKLNGRAGRWPAAFAGLFMLIDPLNVFGRFSGMELPLFGMLTLMLVAALLDRDARRTGWMCGLLVLTRPEGLVLVVAALVYLRWQRSALLPMLWRFGLLVLPWAAYCAVVTGLPFPNTVVMKADLVFDPGALVPTLLALLRDSGWGWSLPMLLLAGAIALDGGMRLLGTLQVGMALLLLGAVLLTRPLQLSADETPYVLFYGQRYALLAWPLLLSVATAGLGSLVRTGYAGLFCRPGAAAMLLGPLVVVLVCARHLPGHADRLRQRFSDQCAQVEAQNVAAGRWIDANLPTDALVATHDAGAVKYFGRREVLDTWGNNNTELAGLIWRGDEGGIIELLARRQPDALVCFPLQYALNHAGPELESLRRALGNDPRRHAEVMAYLEESGDRMASFFGLTRRARTFHVDRSVTVDSPVHSDLAIFVRP